MSDRIVFTCPHCHRATKFKVEHQATSSQSIAAARAASARLATDYGEGWILDEIEPGSVDGWLVRFHRGDRAAKVSIGRDLTIWAVVIGAVV